MDIAPSSTLEFEACNSAINRVCGAYRVICDRWWEFRGGIAANQVGALEVADIRFSNGRVIKDGKLDEHYLGDRHFLVLQASGSAVMRQRGLEARLRPGDLTLIDSRYPSVFEIGEDFRQYSFHLPADLLRDRFGRETVPLATTIRGTHGAGGLLSDTMLSIMRHGDSLQGVDAAELALNLLCKAVGLESSDQKAGHAARSNVVLQDISEYIRAQLHRHDLSPKDIANYLNVSLRQLYRISASAGCTPAGLIWRLRLGRARELLADRLCRTPITEIALSCGFKEVAHFSRAYRKTFGEAPRVARRNAVAGGGQLPDAVGGAEMM